MFTASQAFLDEALHGCAAIARHGGDYLINRRADAAAGRSTASSSVRRRDRRKEIQSVQYFDGKKKETLLPYCPDIMDTKHPTEDNGLEGPSAIA